KKPIAFSGDGLFLNLNDYVLGSGFMGQRHASVALATLALLLTQNSHVGKVNALDELSQGQWTSHDSSAQAVRALKKQTTNRRTEEPESHQRDGPFPAKTQGTAMRKNEFSCKDARSNSA